MSRNPLTLLVSNYDLLFKVICDFDNQIYTNHLKLSSNIEGQTVRNHFMYSNIMLLAVLIAIVSKKCNSPCDNHTEMGI